MTFFGLGSISFWISFCPCLGYEKTILVPFFLSFHSFFFCFLFFAPFSHFCFSFFFFFSRLKFVFVYFSYLFSFLMIFVFFTCLRQRFARHAINRKMVCIFSTEKFALFFPSERKKNPTKTMKIHIRERKKKEDNFTTQQHF